MGERHDEDAKNRISALLGELEGMKPKKRIRRLQEELEAQRLAIEVQLNEGYRSLIFGDQELISEHPVYDDGEAWNEIGPHGRVGFRRSRKQSTNTDLSNAREIGRWLAEEHGHVIGAAANRVNYVVGEGFQVRAVPRTRADASDQLTRELNDFLESWDEQEDLCAVREELFRRADRDGDGLLRTFVDPDTHLKTRFLEPELLTPQTMLDASLPSAHRHALGFGVVTDPQDVIDVRGYLVSDSGSDADPEFVPAWTQGVEIPHVLHVKFNVDRNSPHGWPTFWPVRKNSTRAEKLLRNMSYVAALQAAIALIRKHEGGTKQQVQALLQGNADAQSTNAQTGKTTNHRGMRPGTVIDAPMGTNYESPVSSVNAGNNVKILGAELRAGAVSVNQPEYMFSADTSSGGYANTLVTDGPPSKNFKRLQQQIARTLRQLYEAGVRHESFWGRIDKDALARYRIELTFPRVIVRDLLEEAQRNQILRSMGAISLSTMRRREGLDHETEERLIDEEAEKGYKDPRKGEVEADKPPPGSTPGGPGGGDMRGNPGSPETAASAAAKN